MMKWVVSVLIIASFIAAIVGGKMSALSSAVFDSASGAIELTLTIAAGICLWSGLMRVAEKSGLAALLRKLLTPVLSALFKGLDKNGKALKYISMNITANLLGLGNASTPLGIAAMRELKREEGLDVTASDNMILFVVMNTASLQLIPSTVLQLRAEYGSVSPSAVMPLIWLVSLLLFIAAVVITKLMKIIKGRKRNGGSG